MVKHPNDDIIMLAEVRPTRADALKNRALLLETAQKLFEAQGVDAVSMSAIAEAAGVGKGTLYRHFNNKTEICFSLLDHDQRELQEQTLGRLRTNPDPYDNLRWFLRQVLAFVDSHNLMLGVGPLSEAYSSLEHAAHSWWRMTIRALLQQLAAGGDLDYKADILYILLDPHTIDFQHIRLGYDRDRIERGLLDTLDQLLK